MISIMLIVERIIVLKINMGIFMLIVAVITVVMTIIDQ